MKSALIEISGVTEQELAQTARAATGISTGHLELSDPPKYKTLLRERSMAALDALAAQAQELNMGY